MLLDFDTTWVDESLYPQEKQQAYFRGSPCDDTEHRNYSGLPNWKNYGEWLSECDSLESAWNDSVWAIIDAKHDAERKIEKAKQDSIDVADGDLDFDMDAMWDNTVWNEITDIAESEGYEVENITAVAGVRGAEAEDEALALLYYRQSMRGIAKVDLEKAYGKLKSKRDSIFEKNPESPELEKIDLYLLQIKERIKNT